MSRSLFVLGFFSKAVHSVNTALNSKHLLQPLLLLVVVVEIVRDVSSSMLYLLSVQPSKMNATNDEQLKQSDSDKIPNGFPSIVALTGCFRELGLGGDVVKGGGYMV